jgi:hypothetical protein
MTGRPKEFARRQLILPKRSSIADSSPACIDAHREVYGVEPNCKVLPITPSTYREHVARRRNPETAPTLSARRAAGRWR